MPYPVTWVTRQDLPRHRPAHPGHEQPQPGGQGPARQAGAGATDSVTVSYTGALRTLEDFVVINEVHYDPPPDQPNTAFIELFNRSSRHAVRPERPATRWRRLHLPARRLISPGGYLLLVADRAGIRGGLWWHHARLRRLPRRPRQRRRALGPDPARRRRRPTGHDHQRPALSGPPALADQRRRPAALRSSSRPGPRQLPRRQLGRHGHQRPQPRHARAASTPWPRRSRPFPPVWLNEVQPDNVSGATDGAGDRDPWIELYNAGTDRRWISPPTT